MRYRIVEKINDCWHDVEYDGCTDLEHDDAIETARSFIADPEYGVESLGLVPDDAEVWRHEKSPHQWGYHNADVEVVD